MIDAEDLAYDRRVERIADEYDHGCHERHAADYDVCRGCDEWAPRADVVDGLCPCCAELAAEVAANPFPPTPDPAVDLASPSVDGAGAGVGSPPTGLTPSDRIARDVVRLLAHPLTSAAARVAVVGVSVVGWSYFFAVAVLP